MSRSPRRLALGALLIGAQLLTSIPPSHATEPSEPTVVYLVRHAEKVVADDGDGPEDPPLTEDGQARAEALAHALRDVGLDHVHSSDTRRTRDTAAPIAEATGLDIELYDPRRLADLAAHLNATPGRHLVVGHSNTTPNLAELLGGEPGPEIVEATEYDRLYLLVLGESVTTARLRFGAPSP
ncbi:MAG: phosphoglycerate mutase family protein [Acidobacteriota bacterium]